MVLLLALDALQEGGALQRIGADEARDGDGNAVGQLHSIRAGACSLRPRRAEERAQRQPAGAPGLVQACPRYAQPSALTCASSLDKVKRLPSRGIVATEFQGTQSVPYKSRTKSLLLTTRSWGCMALVTLVAAPTHMRSSE